MESILITGANSGLGFEVAKLFAEGDYEVVAVCRSMEKAKETQRQILELYPDSKVVPMAAELSSIESIRSCLKKLEAKVDHLICNAGISNTKEPQLSKDGFEFIFSVNHLAHYVFAVELYNRFPTSLRSIVVVSSSLHDPEKSKGQFPPPEFENVRDFAYPKNELTSWKDEAGRRYVHSKLCNVLFTYGMSKRLPKGARIRINAFNPGFMPKTNLGRDQSRMTRFMLKYILPLMKPFMSEMKTARESAKALMQVCLESKGSGAYYSGPKEVKSSELSYGEKLIDDLWGLSEELSGAVMKR